MSRIRLPLALLALSVLVASLVGFTSTRRAASAPAATRTPAAAQAPAAGGSVAAALQNDFRRVFNRVSPSVVQIQTSEGLGSGIVFDRKGNIVTNAHVVSGATTFTVTTASGKQLRGTLVGTFTPDDLAVIRVPASAKLRPAAFANSSNVRVGDIAMAIGNPLGLRSSVTQGIVSSLSRTPSEGNGATLRNAIQTSAPINPGNSGGALADIQGRVIGIPTLAATDAELGGAAAGIGFAVPSNVVKQIAAQIVKNGKVVNSGRAFLGVTIGDTGNGVYIGSVSPGSPAAKAGIVAGDVIVAVAGTATPTSDELGTVLARPRPGQTVKVRIARQNGTTRTVEVKLGEFPASG
jgi:S1-C subfamily serine protease